MLQHSGHTHIPNLDATAFSEENILPFQIPVDNFSVVEMLQAQAYLREQVQNFSFVHELTLHFGFLDPEGKVAIVCILHDDIEFALLGGIYFFKFDDVGVVEHF